LENPPRPTERLVAAANLRKKLVANAD